MGKLLTITDAAEYLGVNRVKIYRLLKAGKLKSIPNSLDEREKLVNTDDLDALKTYAPTPLSEFIESPKRLAVALAS